MMSASWRKLLRWPPRRLPPAALLAVSTLVFAGCALGPALDHCRIIGARSEHDPQGFYIVTVLVTNESPRPLDLEEVSFEVTTFDAEHRPITRNASFSSKGQIDRFDVDTIRLHQRDRDGRIQSARVVLKDRHGRTISEWTVGRAASAGKGASTAT